VGARHVLEPGEAAQGGGLHQPPGRAPRAPGRAAGDRRDREYQVRLPAACNNAAAEQYALLVLLVWLMWGWWGGRQSQLVKSVS
jgi:hypothetical protein